MAYKVKPLEHELTHRCFEARTKSGESKKYGYLIQYWYWRGKDEAYADAARLAEKYGA